MRSTSRLSLIGLALACAIPSTALAARPAVYGGEAASTDDPIVLTTDASGVRLASAVVGWSARCTGGDRYVFHGRLATGRQLTMSRNARGSFSGTASLTRDLTSRVGSSHMALTLKGTLRGASASGTLRGTVRFLDVPVFSPTLPDKITLLDSCDTGTLRWKAAHRPGTVYGGVTSQDEAIVIMRSASGRVVTGAHVGWHATCMPDGWVDFPETFTGFPITATGAFGDAFTWRYPNSGGSGDNVYDYDLHGRLTRTSGSGTFTGKVTYPDTTSCATGAQSWSVRSS